MNEIINNSLFIPELHLRHPGFTKKKKRMRKLKERGYSRYISLNKLDKVCFQHDMAYGDFKDVPRRTAPDKVLRDIAFNNATKSKYECIINA